MALSEKDKEKVRVGLRNFAETVAALPFIMKECGVDNFVIEDCKLAITGQVERLNRM